MKWSKERREAKSRAMRGIQWTPEQNAERSRSLQGRKKTLEHRAAMHASHVVGTKRTAEWWEAYHDKLQQLIAETGPTPERDTALRLLDTLRSQGLPYEKIHQTAEVLAAITEAAC